MYNHHVDSSLQYTLFIVLAPLAALVSIGVLLYARITYPSPETSALTGLMLMIAGWLIFNSLELAAVTEESTVFWAKVSYGFITASPVAWLAFALQYTGHPRWLAPARFWVFLVIPCVTTLLAWSNDLHRWLWANYHFTPVAGMLALSVSRGPWYWVHAVYSYALVFLGAWLILRQHVRSFRLYRQQSIWLLIGAFTPIAVNMVYIFRVIPGLIKDYTPISFAVAGVAFAAGMLRHHLFDLKPVARDAVIDSMSDAMLAIDARGRIVDLNPAAQAIIGLPADSIISRPAADVLNSWSDLVRRYRDQKNVLAEIALSHNGTEGYYDLRVSPLTDRQGHPAGRLIVLHDITERKLAEEALRQQNEVLAALHETTLGLIERLDLTGLLQIIVDRAASLMGTPHGYLYIVEPAGTEMVLRVGTGIFADAIGSKLRRETYPPAPFPGREGGRRDPLPKTGGSVAVDGYADWLNAISEWSRLRAVAGLPLRAGAEVIGVIGLAYTETGRVFTSDQIDLLSRFAQLASLALQNARLYAAAQEELDERKRVEAKLQQAKDELERRVVDRTAAFSQANEQLQQELAKRRQAEEALRNLARRLESIRERDGTRIARKVHDELGQMLTALKMDVAWLSKRLPEDDEKSLQKVRAMSESISTAIRSVQRISAELRPGVLDDLGLAAALEWQSQEFQERTDIACRLAVGLDDEAALGLDPDLTTALFRIVQESLTNIARHAQATAVQISLARRDNQLRLVIRDNGKGITPAQVSDPKSLGLIGMRERLHPWQGELIIEGYPGAGTTLTVTVPLLEVIGL